MLGNDKEKKYLIVFQNNDEIRPTWGFMWSSGIVTLYKWNILNYNPVDIYDFERKIDVLDNKNTNVPEWLSRVTTRFGIRDANYYINPKRSSDTIQQFLDTIDVKIDGIVYINQNIIKDAIDALWGIELSGYSWNYNWQNFSAVMSTMVESKISKIWTLGSPKQVLFDFQQEFFTQIQKQQAYADILFLGIQAINSWDLIVTSFEEKEQQILDILWVTWKKDYFSTLDFSYPVFTSLSWNKSDRYMETSYIKSVENLDSCRLSTTLQIKRKHTFNKQDETYILWLIDKFKIEEKEKILKIQWKWQNHQFVRVILPKTAQVLPRPWQK